MDAINNTHCARLGYLCPSQVDAESEPFVRLAQQKIASTMNEKQRDELFPPVDDYLEQQQAISEYDETKERLKPGTFVYCDLPSKDAMVKSFDL